jgi:S-adenosylmethionine:tRNA ribosyltransferase-isomerase
VANALEAILDHMDKNRMESLYGQTRLMIVPGYRFRFTDMLITNFHQPGSTLLLLVAALIGEEWKRAYQYALDHDFRFLSYGDSCLFINFACP